MSAYHPNQERAVRLRARVRDWRESQLIGDEQFDRMTADLDPGLRRTNVYLRATLFVFGMVIAIAATGLLAVALEPNDSALGILLAVAAGACFAAAVLLVGTYDLYRFGIEEALVVTSIVFAGVAAFFLLESAAGIADAVAGGAGLIAAAVVAFAVFAQFGVVYAAVVAAALLALAPFPILDDDLAGRSTAVAILAVICVVARRQRAVHGDEFPGDSYGIIETAAWGGIYLLLNLKASAWLSHPVESGPFYWLTYAFIWLWPAAGLWLAVRERHRLLLDLNIVLAIATMMSNKPYLNAQRNPWDPIGFGILMIAIALGLRRWLDSGDGRARAGVVATRLLASERERLSAAGSVSVVQPSLHQPHAQPADPAIGGGGRSGGAGASGSY